MNCCGPLDALTCTSQQGCSLGSTRGPVHGGACAGQYPFHVLDLGHVFRISPCVVGFVHRHSNPRFLLCHRV